MSKEEPTGQHQKKKKLILDGSLMSNEGISDIELRRQKRSKKKTVTIDISPEEREKLEEQLTKGVSIKPQFKDVLAFLALQFLPMVALASALFILGLYFYFQTSADIQNLMLILQVLGVLFYIYSIIRLISTLSYRIELSKEKLRWRNVFLWKEIPFERGFELSIKRSFYFYLTKIGGLVPIGLEVFLLKGKKQDHWIRAYPLRKATAEQLAKLLTVWIE